MQVEQVLETYFMNLDNTYNKLQTLAEYVDDTEDYIKFEIDTQRNRFIEVRNQLAYSELQGIALHAAC
jgi:magnesium transporter